MVTVSRSDIFNAYRVCSETAKYRIVQHYKEGGTTVYYLSFLILALEFQECIEKTLPIQIAHSSYTPGVPRVGDEMISPLIPGELTWPRQGVNQDTKKNAYEFPQLSFDSPSCACAQTDFDKCVNLLRRSESMIYKQDSLIGLLKEDLRLNRNGLQTKILGLVAK